MQAGDTRHAGPGKQQMALRRCSYTHCPQLIPAGKRYCAEHGRAHERERGTATQRGYGAPHKRLRARWQAAIDNGAAPLCPRCHLPVTRGQAWDLGHNDRRDGYNGPEHASCNRKAGAANSNRMREHWNKQEPTPPLEN